MDRRTMFALAALVVSGEGCRKRVDVQQDTPYAAMRSLISVYAENQPELLGSLVDPALTRLMQRSDACALEIGKSSQCDLKKLECYAARSHPSCVPDECRNLDVKSCTCGPKAIAAADAVSPFVESDLHRGLQLAAKSEPFDPVTCNVTAANEIEFNDVSRHVSTFSLVACGEVSADDKYAAVTAQCGKGQPTTYIFRGRDGVWKLLGLETRAAGALRVAGAAANKRE